MNRSLFLLGFSLLGLFGAQKIAANHLESFITTTDQSYDWNHEKSIMEKEYSVHILKMTSQTWRSEKEVNKNTWDHWVKIIVPHKVKKDKALLFVRSGNHHDPMPEKTDDALVQSAISSNSVIAEIYNIPNQPLKFSPTGDQNFPHKGQKEDELLAISCKKYLETNDLSWPLHFPMVKSIVKGMDCVEAFLKTLPKKPVELKGFVLTGRSKRAWVSWLTAVIDSRVVGIIPVSCDFINLKQSIAKNYKTYGQYSSSLQDFAHLAEKMNTRAGEGLFSVIDPFTYREKLTLPKFIINSSGDDYTPPDSSQHYFHDLLGKKYLRYVPNSSHDIERTNYLESTLAFYEAMISNKPLPVLSWVHQKDGTLLITTSSCPFQVTLWQAANEDSRDFRFDSIGAKWEGTTLKKQTDGIYVVDINTPKNGWTAYFVELKYSNGKAPPFTFTTDVFITPDEHPFEANDAKADPKHFEID